LSSGDIGELLREEYVKSRVREVLENLVVRMDGVMRGYLGAVQATIMRYYGIKPVMTVDSNFFDYGVEYRITLYIDSRDVKRIEEIARRELEDKQVRIKVLRRILAEELKSEEG
jgi:peptide methionine sulfoxide reductase MsrA